MIPENHKESGRQEREKSPKVIQKELVLNNSPKKDSSILMTQQHLFIIIEKI